MARSLPGRPYRGISVDARRAARRARLIEAGIEVFGDAGVHAATVRAICQRASLTERYFYESFENREALFGASYEHVIAQMSREVLAAIAGAGTGAPDRVARAALTAYFRYLQREPRAARVMLIEPLGVSERIDRLYRRATADFTALIRRVAEALHPAQARQRVDDELVSAGLVGAVILIATQWVLAGCRPPIGRVVDSALLIFDAVSRRLQQGPEPAARRRR